MNSLYNIFMYCHFHLKNIVILLNRNRSSDVMGTCTLFLVVNDYFRTRRRCSLKELAVDDTGQYQYIRSDDAMKFAVYM